MSSNGCSRHVHMYRADDKLNKTAFMLSILATVYIYIYILYIIYMYVSLCVFVLLYYDWYNLPSPVIVDNRY